MGLGLPAALAKTDWRVKRRARDVVLRRGVEVRTIRGDIAGRYLRGDGIEIGPLDIRLERLSGARVGYVDRKDLAGQRADFPNLADRAFVAVNVVDDGERLATLPDGSVDFVVAT